VQEQCKLDLTDPTFATHIPPYCTPQIYHYRIDTGVAHDPLTFRHRMHCARALDVDAMRAAAALLVGTHDFTQYSNNAPERLRRNPVKDLWRLDVIGVEGGLRLEVEGSGFLYKQVRHMVGALVAVGEGKMDLSDISRRLEVGNKQAPGGFIDEDWVVEAWLGFRVLMLVVLPAAGGVGDTRIAVRPHVKRLPSPQHPIQ